MIRVLVADDHPVVRQGLRTFLDLQEDLEVVGEAADGAEAVAMAGALTPDVVLLDLRMPVLDGLGALREMAALGLGARVIVLTSVSDGQDVAPAMRSGAAGFLYKDVEPAALAQAVRSVHGGQVVLAPEAAEAVLSQPPGGKDHGSAAGTVAVLTDREREVLALIASGRSNREIARHLVVAEKTVKTHVSNVLMKLGVQDRTQAALYAVRHGLA
ncbi:response regulator [Sphaerisporangium rhizosphaerae]|uniref:Response regulator n=1 Tax=Sphaerisporangium rhizosphaerae TaxID=2269375 RepID=A0ABW2PCC9_9ACTN